MVGDVASLIKRRSVQKGRLTKHKTILASADRKTHAEIEMRIKQLQDCISQYNTIYDELYELSEYDDAHANDFIQFEEDSTACLGKYFEVLQSLRGSNGDVGSASDKSAMISTKDIKEITSRPVDPKIKHFSGNFEEWSTFKEVYMAYIHCKSYMANIEKYVHLRGYLQGDAFDLIKNIAFTDTGYELAWEALCERYGNKRRIVSHHIDSLLKISKGNKVTSGKELQTVVDECNNHILSVNALDISTNNWDLLVIGLVLPRLDNDTREMWESEKVIGELPTWEELKNFLNSRCRVLEAIVTKSNPSHATVVKDKPKSNTTKTYTKSFVTNTLTSTKFQCNLCGKNDHFSSTCPDYLALPDSEKFKKIQSLRLCLNCLRKGHIAKDCRSTRCKKCQRSHNTTLHEFYQAQSVASSGTNDLTQPVSQSAVNTVINGTGQAQVNTSTGRTFHIASVDKTVLLSTAQIQIMGVDNQVYLCRALLDSASENNFITDELAQKLGLVRQQHYHYISGIDTISVKTKHKVATTIKSRISNYSLNIEFLVIPKITDRLPKYRIQLGSMEIPHDIQLADPLFNVPSSVDILIGAQYFFDLLKQQRIKIAEGLPPLHATEFGFIMAGEVDQNFRGMNFALTSTQKVDDDLHNLVSKLWSLDTVITKTHLSEEQAECQNHFINTLSRNCTGRYVVKLPFRNNLHELGESKNIAFNRFLSVERKLQRNEEMKLEYAKFIQEYVALGHMQKVPNDNSVGYYLPHHCIVKPSSTTTKLRVVFDASAKTTSGLSLNDTLLDGPRTQDDLLDIVLRFRIPKYVFSGDIEKMYRQVEVAPEHRRFQRILYRESPDDSIATYELATVTYGVKPAAYLATAVLKQIGIDEGDKFPLGRRALRDFYVDDVMTGDDDIDCVINMKNQLCQLLAMGGMRLRKFVSNSSRFMSTIPADDREIEADLDQLSPNTFIKALGLKWDPSNDKLMLSFHNFYEKKPTTKREILSIVAGIFDPLGLAAPVVIRAKIFLQKLWLQHVPWDQTLSPDLLDQFHEFLDDFSSIQSISTDRCITSSQPQILELHGFADASQAAYGACIYIRAINNKGIVTVNLLCAKSRVAPLKHQTIPRLELCGALLLSRLYHKVTSVLDIKFDKACLWSDSTIVLAWIKTPSYQLKEFVASRVSEIQELTNGIPWYHVNSRENIADVVSRGCSLECLAFDDSWWHGPKFLMASLDFEQYDLNLSKIEVIERKEQQFVLSTQLKRNAIGDLIHRHSSYLKLLRIVRYCDRFINEIIKIRNKKLTNKEPISIFDENTTALYILVHSVQSDAFAEEAKALQSNKQCPRSSSLRSLTPFNDKFGIIRVGGRISKSNLPYEQCHQILLPNTHHFTDVMFRHYHVIGLHSGSQSLLYQTRQLFWTIKGKLAAKRTISRCVVCIRQTPRPAQQLMGELPADRVSPHKAFTVVGVDYCGPFLTRIPSSRCKTTLKSYIGVFVCFSTRAIHLEVISDLTTAAFIATLHRFISRRGKPTSIHSDNGTNFVGSSNHLKSLELFFKSSNIETAIKNWCDDHNISWHFIPPRSPHHGGLWEAGVKAVKHHLRRVTNEHALSFEELSTLAARIECCLNSRPLSVLSDDPNDPQPLTPAHFLIGGPLTTIDEPDITSTNINRLKRWDQIQHMTQSFWKKWSIEYLQSLQKRTKWKAESPNLQVGQIVLVHPEQGFPAKWILGMIIDVACGSDGFVRVVTVRTKSGTFKRSIQKQSLLAGRIPIASTTGPIKRGLLWQQRDRLFSRWKERYFVLTRDYLHCFKRASGSANERISDMGQFIFKVKLVDVEKVEWLNRRSYSAIGLLLGSREGRVLLRCDNGLEDWFELLEECTLNSKQRRQALRITQGPRSRASLAAPPSHASLYANHLGLGGTYSSAIEDWLLTRNKSINSTNHFILSDSVPDLTSAINDNHSGITTNHSTPKKIPNNSNSLSKANGNLINLSGSPNCYHHHPHHNHHNSPTSRIIKNKNYDSVLIEDEEEVQLRRGNNQNGFGYGGVNGLREHGVNDNENKDSNWMYRKPLGPHDQRHSLLTDIDITACDSGLDTPPSTHRPSSYRDVYYMTPGTRDSTDTGVSSSRGTLVSPGGSIRGMAHQQHTNTNGSRYSVQEKSSIAVQRQWQQNNHDSQSSIRSNNKILSEFYNEINSNKYMNGNGHANTNFNGMGSGQSSIRDNRYQNPALAAIINEAQGMKFRDRSYSDIQQIPRRTWNDNPQSPKRFLGTPTRV